MWTYRDGKPWYFLEEMYPAYGNLVPRDIATRAIFKVVYEMGLGVDGQPLVYLDVSHIDPAILNAQGLGRARNLREVRRPGSAQGADEDFPGDALLDGRAVVSTTTSMTNITGLFAGGECDYQYHGANRLGANSLLSCIYAGMVAGPVMADYAKAHPAPSDSRIYDQETTRQREDFDQIFKTAAARRTPSPCGASSATS